MRGRVMGDIDAVSDKFSSNFATGLHVCGRPVGRDVHTYPNKVLLVLVDSVSIVVLLRCSKASLRDVLWCHDVLTTLLPSVNAD